MVDLAPDADRVRRLLVIQFGQLGDTILSLPALDLIRDSYPNARLTVACGMPANEILALWGRADAIEPLNRVRVRDSNPLFAFGLIAGFIHRIWRPTPDAAVVLHPNSEMQLVAYCTGARRRAGLITRDGLFSRLINEPMAGVWQRQHAATSYYALAAAFCGRPPADGAQPPMPRLSLPETPQRNGRIAIHVGASRKSKRVSAEVWLAVARALAAQTGKEIAYIGGPEEPDLARTLAEQTRGARVLTGLSIAQLAREVAASGFFLGTDSGPGHLAAALQTPSLTLIERHVQRRYHTLGAHAERVSHRGVNGLRPDEIVDAVLRHKAFPRGTQP